MAFNQNKYITNWKREHKYRPSVEIPIEKKALLQALAKKHNVPINQLVIYALEQTYKIDLSSED